MRRFLPALALAALAALLAAGQGGTLYGAILAAREVQKAPAAVAAAALLLLIGGAPRPWTAAGWVVLGLAGAVAWRAALGTLGLSGWMPGETTPPSERIAEILGLLAVAALAWRGGPAALAGPLLAATLATTRIGGYAQALVPIAFEDTAAEALALGAGIAGGLAAGAMVVLLAGWALAILARIPGAWLPPGRVLAALAAAAAIGHMLAR